MESPNRGRTVDGDRDKYGATDVGRASNEDCHAALVGDGCPTGIDAPLIVADGLGGHAAGEVAST